jgi:hypothetical protein
MFDKNQGRVRLEGHIAAAGFASGDRFVIGLWDDGPLGRMTDVMWARADGTKVLLASSDDVARFVGGVYSFDEVRVVPTSLDKSSVALRLEAGPLTIHLTAGDPLRVFALRPRLFRRSPLWVRFEDMVVRPLVAPLLLRGGAGVRLYGRSPSGVREWYCIDSYRPLRDARAGLEGRDLGPLAPLDPPAEFGFSEFPRRPALVGCAPLLEGAERFLPPGRTAEERSTLG